MFLLRLLGRLTCHSEKFLSFTPGRLAIDLSCDLLCCLPCCHDSIPAAPSFSDTSAQPSRDAPRERRESPVSPMARQTARQTRRGAEPAQRPTTGHPGTHTGGDCCCNRPGNRGNRRSRPAPRPRVRRRLAGAAHTHTLSRLVVRPRSRCIQSALPKAQRRRRNRFLIVSSYS